MASSKGKNALQKYEKVAQPLMLVRLPISTYIRPQLLGPKHARRAKSRGSCAADRCWKLSSRLWLWCWLFKIKSLQHSYDLGLFMFVVLLRHSCTVCTSSFWQLPVGCLTEGLFESAKGSSQSHVASSLNDISKSRETFVDLNRFQSAIFLLHLKAVFSNTLCRSAAKRQQIYNITNESGSIHKHSQHFTALVSASVFFKRSQPPRSQKCLGDVLPVAEQWAKGKKQG